jgi:2-polyprenyl-6-methoxyphenol hydroxylase-like FAD-dependent oxidoreductase
MQGIMLKRLGHNVQVLEQNRSSERLEGGTGITIGPDALQFFNRYDLMKRPFSVPNPGIQIFDNKLHLKRFIKRPMQMSSWNQLYYILRANFDGYKSSLYPEPPAPLEGDGEAVFSVGKKVTDVVYLDGNVTVQYEDLFVGGEHSIQGGLVIVADGASSRIRSILLPQVRRDYSGYLAWRGYVNESQLSEETRKALDPRFTSYSCKGGYILR